MFKVVNEFEGKFNNNRHNTNLVLYHTRQDLYSK